MHVFVTGATGYIGGAVATRLVRAGHQVTGLARTPEAARLLGRRGIAPVVGDLSDHDVLRRAAGAADAVVNAGTSYGPDRGDLERAAVRSMLTALSAGGTFLYTSDQLVYGDTGPEPADEDRPLNPPPFLTWRPRVEQDVLHADGVRAIVLRPVAVYGHGGNQLFPGWIDAARRRGHAPYVGTGARRWSLVHVEDVAEGYVSALDRAPAGAVLNLAAEPPVTLRDLAAAVADAAGVGGGAVSTPLEEVTDVFGPAAQMLDTVDLVASPARARTRIGWTATRPGVLEDLRSGSYRTTTA